jgi:hypothetical protein
MAIRIAWLRLLLLLVFSLVTYGTCKTAAALSTKTTYAADIYFNLNSAELTLKGIASIDHFVALGDMAALEVVVVVGHASTDERHPQVLGERRVKAVKLHLLKRGVPPGRVYWESMGVLQPVEGADISKNRRVDLEFVGTYSASVKTKGFNLISRWQSEFGKAGPTDQRDEWTGLSPLQFMLRIQDRADSDRFNRKLQLVAIQTQDDALLRHLKRLENSGTPLPDESLPPALYAVVFGNAFAQNLFGGDLPRLAPDDPRRVAYAKQLWCRYADEVISNESLDRILPLDQRIAPGQPNDQYEWIACAADRGSKTDIQWLKRRGIDVNVMRDGKWSALHLAAASGNLLGVKLLVEEGANVNARGEQGRTSMHQAAAPRSRYGFRQTATAKEWREIWEVLLAAGADVNAKDDQGRTPLDLLSNEYRDNLKQ